MLADQLKIVLADSFAMYLKAHYYHWNVEGPDFKQYHDLFAEIYEEVYGAVDKIAEEIRALDVYAPGSMERFKELSKIAGETSVPRALEMVKRLYDDNQQVLNSLMSCYKMAEEANEIGLSNFIQDRYDAHKKHAWMLRATLVNDR